MITVKLFLTYVTRNVFKKDSASGVTDEGLGYSPHFIHMFWQFLGLVSFYFVLKNVIEIEKCLLEC